MGTPVETVKALYEAFKAKNESRLRELLHPEVEWVQCAGFPGGGHHHGVDAVLQGVFGKLTSQWSQWRAVIDEYICENDKVVVLGKYVATHGQTSKQVEAVFAHVYTVQQSQIVHFMQYTDTAPLVEAAR